MTQPENTKQYVWKIVVGGAGGVGKTTIVHRYVSNEFIPDMKMTVGVQFHIVEKERQNNNIKLMVWDLGGQERFRFVQKEYLKGASGAFVLFDMGDIGTLFQARKWIEFIRTHTKEGIPIVLVGAKMDTLDTIGEQDHVNEESQKIADEMGCKCYVPTSSKIGINVTETLDYMIDYLVYLTTK